jgi:hypothetical protein
MWSGIFRRYAERFTAHIEKFMKDTESSREDIQSDQGKVEENLGKMEADPGTLVRYGMGDRGEICWRYRESQEIWDGKSRGDTGRSGMGDIRRSGGDMRRCKGDTEKSRMG